MNIFPVTDEMKKQLNAMPISVKDLSLKLQSHALTLQKGMDRLLCLEEINIEHKPWQIETAIKVLRDMRGSALLADEVGLGKTIEAGLIIKELLHRGLIGSVLILVPPSLVEQWKREMFEKFELDFYDMKQKDWKNEKLLISSLPFLIRSTEKREELSDRVFDLVIVDEAHALKNHNSSAYKFVYALKRNYTILMSATPIQNDMIELFNLINVIKPGYLKSRKRFRTEYMINKFTPKNTDRLKKLLSEIMIRHKRSNTLVELPRRKVTSNIVDITNVERSFHNGILEFCRRVYQMRGDRNQFLLLFIQLLKQNCSSPQSAVNSLIQNVLPKMADSEEIQICNEIIALGQSISIPSKAVQLAKTIGSTSDQFLVYTEYKATMSMLKDYLESKGIKTVCYHGSMTIKEKEKAIFQFKNGDYQVFLSSESGGQGLNLQFCHRLINYDLPWNPMRIEQRIGRVHRFGQEKSVDITTLATQGTIDEYILYILTSKVNLFEMVIGEIDTIMNYVISEDSSFEVEIGKIILESKTSADMERKLRAIGEKMLKAKTLSDSEKEKNHQLLNKIGLMRQ